MARGSTPIIYWYIPINAVIIAHKHKYPQRFKKAFFEQFKTKILTARYQRKKTIYFNKPIILSFKK